MFQNYATSRADPAATAEPAERSAGGMQQPHLNQVAPEPGEELAEFQVVMDLLESPDFQGAPATYKGQVRRLEMIEEKGLPPLQVISARKLAELGRIPRSTEGHAVKALDEVKKYGSDKTVNGRSRVILVFFSHRWKRPNWCRPDSCEHEGQDLDWGSDERKKAGEDGWVCGDPDDSAHTKAKALIEWAKYCQFASEVMHGVLREVYFFIDYTCVDQTDPGPGIIALPAYVASVNRICSYYTEEYYARAWCQVEILMGYAFNFSGKHVQQVEEGFQFMWQIGSETTEATLPDPAQSTLTNKDERPIIEKLTMVATRSTAFSYKNMLNHFLARSRCMMCSGFLLFPVTMLMVQSFTRTIRIGTSKFKFSRPHTKFGKKMLWASPYAPFATFWVWMLTMLGVIKTTPHRLWPLSPSSEPSAGVSAERVEVVVQREGDSGSASGGAGSAAATLRKQKRRGYRIYLALFAAMRCFTLLIFVYVIMSVVLIYLAVTF